MSDRDWDRDRSIASSRFFLHAHPMRDGQVLIGGLAKELKSSIAYVDNCTCENPGGGSW